MSDDAIPDERRERPGWWSDGGAVAAVGVAALARLALEPVLGDSYPFPPFLIAAALVAGFGRTRAAVLALLGGGLLGVFLFVPPRHTFPIADPNVLLALALYLVVGSVVVAMSHVMRLARRRADELLVEVTARERIAAEQREQFRTTLASIGDAVITTDTAGRVTNLNPVAEALTGWATADAAGRPLDAVFRIVNESTRLPVQNPALRALTEGVVVGLANHTILIAKDGSERPIDDSAAPIRDGSGGIAGAVLVFRDITERKRLERENAERLESARFLAAIIESSDDAIISKSLDGTIRSWNAAAERLFGYTVAEAVGRPITLLIPPDRMEEEDRILSRLRAGEPVEHFETVRLRQGGQPVPVALTVSPIKDEAGRVVAASKIVRDISERRKAERLLHESEERAAFVRASSGIGFWYCDLPFDVLEWDALVKAHFWLPPDATVTIHTFYDRIHPDDRAPTHRAIEASIAGRTHYDTEYRTVDPNTGAVRWVRAIGRTFYAADGRPTRFDGVTLDITEAKRAAATLRESEGRYRTLVEQVKEHAIFGTDTAGRATTWNEGVRRVLGFEEAEFVGRDIVTAIFTPEDVANGTARRELELAAANGSASDDRWMMRKDGTRFWAAGITSARRDDGGQLLGFTKVMRDMTAQKVMENELRRLAADLSEADRRKDEFLALLAHELRNPLAPIRNGLQVLRLSHGRDSRFDKPLTMMERQLGQMVRLVDDLLDVSRITRGQLDLRRERIDLRAVVEAAVETSGPPVEQAGHALAVAVPPGPVWVDGDFTRLAQVVSNLLNNAAKYTPGGGRIRLTVEAVGGEAVIRVSDNGIGIPPDMLTKVFDLFTQVDRSLEKTTGGLGIGLSLVKGLVEMHGGSIAVHSDGEGQGSEFVVRLPVLVADPGTADGPAEPSATVATPRRHRRVLVIDDNRDAADTLAELLELLGNEVRTAYDGEDGVRVAGEFRPAVVLCDLGMPKLNGYDAARRIRAEAWGRGVVLVALTGWGQDGDRRKTAEAGFDHHLVKPVDPAALLKFLPDPVPAG